MLLYFLGLCSLCRRKLRIFSDKDVEIGKARKMFLKFVFKNKHVCTLIYEHEFFCRGAIPLLWSITVLSLSKELVRQSSRRHICYARE